MATRLHQILAIQRGVTADTEARLTEIRRILAVGGKEDPLTGISRTYTSRRGADGDQLPPESKKVQVTVPELLGAAREQLTRLFSLEFTRTTANQLARANVVIDGVTLLEDVPAGYLLFLEAELGKLLTLVGRLPTLSLAEEWHSNATDPALPDGVWASEPRQTDRGHKVPKFQVMVDPTPEHRAEIRQWDADEIEGYWTVVRYSGQLPQRDVQAMHARLVKALEAVRYAREAANSIEVTDRDASPLLGYVFGSLA